MEIHGEVKNFTPAPAGNHIATCTGIIVVGTIEEEYNGHKKKQKKLFIIFELTNTKMEGKEEPYLMYIEYTQAMGSTANLRKMLESWRGSKFTDVEAKVFNIANIVGAPCLANVVHETKDNKVRAKVMGITQVPVGTAVPAAKTKSIMFQPVAPFATDVFNQIPEWIRKKIEGSDEFKLLGASTTTQNVQQPAGQENNPFASTGANSNVTPENATKLF